MTGSSRRVGWAAGLIALAIVAPSSAWWIVGSSAAAREAADLEERAWRRVQDRADRAALGAARRLEATRERETARPWIHWRHAWVEDDASCDCPAVRVSPLADADPDPAIRAWFAIDEAGTVDVAGSPASAVAMTAALEGLAAPLVTSLEGPPARDEILEPEPVDQAMRSVPPAPAAVATLIAQGPFQWRTVALDGVPHLVAIRELRTDAGRTVQGFVVDIDLFGREIGPDAVGVRLVHGPAGLAGESSLPLAGTAWRVVADPGPDVAAARVEAAGVRRKFLATFVFGAAGACLAGLLGLGLVHQRERAASVRERWAAAAAHELRGPLAALRLHGDLLARRLERPDQARATLAIIAREIDDLERLVDNVIAFGRLRRGARSRAIETGDPGETVAAVVRSARPAIEDLGARITLRIDDDLPPARFDPDGLRHVLWNLLDNAARHGASGGRPEVDVRVRADAGGVAIDIEDHGTGLAGEVVHRVLVRGRETAPRADGGLGIGLTLARALTIAMDGQLVHAVPDGGGCRMTVVLRSDPELVVDAPD